MRRLVVMLALAPLGASARDTRDPILLVQRAADGGTLCTGCATAVTEVEVSASSDLAACAVAGTVYQLDVEVREEGVAFDGGGPRFFVTMVKPPCTQQAYPWVRVTGLMPGVAYRWQANESCSTGSVASWVPYAGGATAFAVVFADAGSGGGGGAGGAGGGTAGGGTAGGGSAQGGGPAGGQAGGAPAASQLGVACGCGTGGLPLALLALAWRRATRRALT